MEPLLPREQLALKFISMLLAVFRINILPWKNFKNKSLGAPRQGAGKLCLCGIFECVHEDLILHARVLRFCTDALTVMGVRMEIAILLNRPAHKFLSAAGILAVLDNTLVYGFVLGQLHGSLLVYYLDKQYKYKA